MEHERWFEILEPRLGIRSIVVGKDARGFKVDIHGTSSDDYFEGGDTIQDRLSDVISILKNYVGPDSKWIDYVTREPVHVWDALTTLSSLEARRSDVRFPPKADIRT